MTNYQLGFLGGVWLLITIVLFVQTLADIAYALEKYVFAPRRDERGQLHWRKQ
jgi:hypothetical protein